MIKKPSPPASDAEKSNAEKICLQKSESMTILESEDENRVRQKKITVEVTYDFWESLHRESFNQKLSMQEYVHRLIRLGLQKQKQDDSVELEVA